MDSTSDIYMARQPIFDRGQELVAYELLYRRRGENAAGEIGARESAESLMNSLVDIGLNRLAEGATAYVNVDEHLLGSETLMMFPPERVVLELLETVEATEENVRAVQRLVGSGYTIALDDFESNPDTTEFLPYAKIIKLDVMALGSTLPGVVRKLRRPGVKLLGEKVESKAEFDACASYGVELFQGYFFSRPEIVEGKSIPPNRLATMQLVSKLQSTDATIDEIEQLIVADLGLSYRLLRLVKSAHLGLPERAGTIRSALMFLGVKSVAALASVLAMSASSDKPAEILVSAFTRAKMCELLTPRQRKSDKDRFFTAGLFSVLDALLDLPMADILTQLHLDAEITSALLDADPSSDIASTLKTVMHFERAQWDSVDFGPTVLEDAYYNAVDWASETAKLTRSEKMAA